MPKRQHSAALFLGVLTTANKGLGGCNPTGIFPKTMSVPYDLEWDMLKITK